MQIRVAKNHEDSVAASRIFALSWKTTYRGMFPDDVLNAIPLDRWVVFFDENYGDHARPDVAILSENGVDIAAGAYGASRSEEGIGEIVAIYSLPESWGSGAGKALLDFMLEKLREQGFSAAHLWVLDKNMRAQRFYEKCGFSASGKELQQDVFGQAVRELGYHLSL